MGRSRPGLVIGLWVLLAAFALAALAFVVMGWGYCSPAWTQPGSKGAEACTSLLEANEVGASGEFLSMAGMGLAVGTLGAFLAYKRPDNAIGWWFVATGLMFAGNTLSSLYAIHFVNEDPGVLPGGMVAALISQVLGGPIIFLGFIYLFLLFPTGRFLSPRWRWIAVLGTSALALSSFGALVETELRFVPLDENPLGSQTLQDLRALPEMIAGVVMLGTVAASMSGIFLRYRRSHGEERQQMRWITWAAGLLGVTLLLAPIFWATPSLEPVWGYMWFIAVASIPISAAVAIMKYRLYEIDVIVNRTMVYVALSVILALLYLGGVVVLQRLLEPLTAESDLAVAGSTLAVAALFRPLRTRVQTFIDRRFYRRKYDAAETLSQFSARLRDQVDLDSLSSELVGVVGTTMQPAHASLWLRSSGPRV